MAGNESVMWVVWWTRDRLVAAQFATGAGDPVLRRWEAREGTWSEETLPLGALTGIGLGSGARLRFVPGDLPLLAKNVVVPVVAVGQQAMLLEKEVEQAIPSPLSEIAWDTLQTSDDGIEQEHILVALRRDPLDVLGADLARAGLLPDVVGAVPTLEIGAWRAAGANDTPTLVVHVAVEGSYLLFASGERVFVRALKTGLSFGSGEALVARLRAEIVRSIAAFRRQHPEAAPQQIALHGSRGVHAIAQDLATAVGLPLADASWVEDYDPDGVAPEDERLSLLPLLVGAALQDAEGVNLLPESLRVKAETRAQFKWVGAAAALVALAGLLFAGAEFVALGQAKSQLADYRKAVAPLEARTAELQNEALVLHESLTRIRGLEGLARSRTNWSVFLSDLQERLVAVEDVWIDRLSVVRAEEGPIEPTRELEPWEEELLDVAEVTPTARRYELQLEGRMIDRRNPLQRVSADMRTSVNDLLDRFAESDFVDKVTDKRFDLSEKGILRFSFTLVINPELPL